MIDAVHILLLMRFCTNCIGKHRVNKKIVGIIFAAFFIVSCYLRLMPVSKKFSAANTILFVFEILFLLVVVFLFQGKIAVRLAVALLLPVIYWVLLFYNLHLPSLHLLILPPYVLLYMVYQCSPATGRSAP